MIWLFLAAVHAHDFSPGVVELTETRGAWTLTWEPPAASPNATVMTNCGAGPALDCLPDHLRVDGLTTGAEVLVLRPDTPPVSLTAAQPTLDRSPETRWVAQGSTHVLTGFDHVLFVLGLVALVPRRKLLVAVTAFTVGHATSLAAASWGLVVLPTAPVEACIALSIVYMARQLALNEPLPPLLPAAFGLLHGLGFASALVALGLPEAGLPAVLLRFHLGIEAAQIAVVLAALPLVGRVPRPILALGLGGTAVCWTIQRVLALGAT